MTFLLCDLHVVIAVRKRIRDVRQQQRVKLRELNPNHDDTAFEGINVQINSLGPNLKN